MGTHSFTPLLDPDLTKITVLSWRKDLNKAKSHAMQGHPRWTGCDGGF